MAATLDLPGLSELAPAGPAADLAWAASGAMALTGLAQGPPRLAPAPLAGAMQAALAALAGHGADAALARLDAGALLGERAALLGLRRRGATSPGGSCRLLRAADGWLALNLARPDDRALLPAWLGTDAVDDAWRVAEARVRERPLAALVAAARLLGLPAAEAGPPPREAPPWCRVAVKGEAVARSREARPRVLDLSSLWAGPLCTHLLALAGAQVFKLESASRPDGARAGEPRFFDLLNACKPSLVLDFTTARGREALLRLVERVDVVVESARPRAFSQLGVDAEALVRARPGLTWLSITGYGRAEPQGGWVAFGDDAAAASGLALATGGESAPIFCGDAIADPLAGVHAALAAWASFRAGGGRLLDVALRDVVAHWLVRPARVREAQVEAVAAGHQVVLGAERAPVRAPRARTSRQAARPLGADTHAVFRELGIAC